MSKCFDAQDYGKPDHPTVMLGHNIINNNNNSSHLNNNHPLNNHSNINNNNNSTTNNNNISTSNNHNHFHHGGSGKGGGGFKATADDPCVTSILSQKSMDYVRRNSFGDLSRFSVLFIFICVHVWC